MNVWVDVGAALFNPRYAWVTVLSSMVSAWYAYLRWCQRRRSSVVDSARDAATVAVSGSLVILLIHAVGAFVGETQDERTAKQAEDARFKIIQTAQLVSHIDSGSGHIIVLVVYRPDSASARTVEALGAAARGGHGQRVEFYPVACCVSRDSAARFFSHSTLPYRPRLVVGRSDPGTFATILALGAALQPNADGVMSVIDAQGNVVAHWSALPDSSELRETLH